MNNNSKTLAEKYAWLEYKTTVEEYIDPVYYNNILKDYIFNGKTDLEYFKEWLDKKIPRDDKANILELGCGSGRATDVTTNTINPSLHHLKLLDLSNQMLDYTQKKTKHLNNISTIQSDTIDYLEKTDEKFDLVYSLWSFSHSVHQWLTRLGMDEGKEYLQKVLRKFITKNMTENAEFFLIHFDSKSDEQTILLRQWKKVFPIYDDLNNQSPSKQLIDEELNRLKNENIADFECNHLIGEEIVYSSEEEALEVFMNFHMEAYFNDSELLPVILGELKQYFKQYTDEKGRVKIKPGCFIYKIKKGKGINNEE